MWRAIASSVSRMIGPVPYVTMTIETSGSGPVAFTGSSAASHVRERQVIGDLGQRGRVPIAFGVQQLDVRPHHADLGIVEPDPALGRCVVVGRRLVDEVGDLARDAEPVREPDRDPQLVAVRRRRVRPTPTAPNVGDPRRRSTTTSTTDPACAAHELALTRDVSGSAVRAPSRDGTANGCPGRTRPAPGRPPPPTPPRCTSRRRTHVRRRGPAVRAARGRAVASRGPSCARRTHDPLCSAPRAPVIVHSAGMLTRPVSYDLNWRTSNRTRRSQWSYGCTSVWSVSATVRS